MRPLLLALLCWWPHTSLAIKARGAYSAVIEVNTARGTGTSHNVVHSVQPLNLWCQAVDDQGRPLQLVQASFRSKTQIYPATLSTDKRNSSISVENVPAHEAGKWHCDLQTDYGNATGIVTVFVRPIVQNNPNIRVDEKDGDKFHVEVSGTTVTVGDSAELHCPAFGHPQPTFTWRKGGKNLPGTSDTYKIAEAKNEDDAVYTCIASNSIGAGGAPRIQSVTIDQHLRIKNKLAWLAPFCVIVVTLILLVATIVFCECRKRGNQGVRKAQDDD